MAHDLAAEGYSLVEIQQAGRWDNKRTVLRYISKLAVLDGAVAKRHRSRVAASGLPMEIAPATASRSRTLERGWAGDMVALIA